MKWTKSQHEAINHRDGNLLVAAGAGSGKTAVLVERIISIVCDKAHPCDITKLLVVTFTKKAASEMKERVAKSLMSLIKENPTEEYYHRQLSLLKNSNITTIHSFCLTLVRKYFYLLDLDPRFKVCDDAESKLLKSEAIENIKEKLCLDEKYQKLLDYYGFKNRGKQIEDILFDLENLLSAVPDEEEWFLKQIGYLEDESFEDNPACEMIKNYLVMVIDGIIEQMTQVINKVSEDEYLFCYEETFEDGINQLKQISNSINSDLFFGLKKLIVFKFERLKRVKKEANQELKEWAMQIKKDVTKTITDLTNQFSGRDKNIIISENKKFIPIFKDILELYKEYKESFNSLKQSKQLIDFQDIEHYCLKLVKMNNSNSENENILYDIKQQFSYIFIDEYQDSNMVQEMILKAVSKCDIGVNNMFMVGDVKQSIYRFRMAMPELFMYKYKTYSDNKNSTNRKIKLYENFRSRNEIIDFINKTFAKIMYKDVGEIGYKDNEELEAKREYPNVNSRKIHISIYERENNEENDELKSWTQTKKESSIIMNTINSLVGKEEIYDEKSDSMRKISYRDIVVLTRSSKNYATQLKDFLIENKINAYTQSDEGYFEQLEIKTFLSLLTIIDNPLHDIHLAAVMRSFIGEFDIGEIARIRYIDKSKSLIEILYMYKDNNKKISVFLDKIEKYREYYKISGIRALLIHVMKEESAFIYFGALTNGNVRKSNLRLLLKRAQDFELKHASGIFGFLHYVVNIARKSIIIESAKAIGENDDVVRIMTIHASKGLQFPVVILANANKGFNKQDERKSILFHRDFPIGFEFIDRNEKTRYSSFYKIIQKKKIRLENISEEIRILYVALTRTKERLHIIGGMKDVDKQIKNIIETNDISSFSILNGKSYLDWILKSIHSYAGIFKNENNIGCFDENVNITIENVLDLNTEKIDEDINNFTTLDSTNKISEFLDEKFNTINKISLSKKYPAKMTVTELKKYKYDLSIQPLKGEVVMKDQYNGFDKIKPIFKKENDNMTSVEKGTLYHYIMQLLDFKIIKSNNDVYNQIESLINKQILSKNEIDQINISQIVNFFNSDIAYDMMTSTRINKEIVFSVFLNDYVGLENDKTMLQGVIDLYYEKDNELILVDYKTDFIKFGEENKLIERYKSQLNHYKYALEKLTKKKVSRKIIYSFSLSKCIEIL